MLACVGALPNVMFATTFVKHRLTQHFNNVPSVRGRCNEQATTARFS